MNGLGRLEQVCEVPACEDWPMMAKGNCRQQNLEFENNVPFGNFREMLSRNCPEQQMRTKHDRQGSECGFGIESGYAGQPRG